MTVADIIMLALTVVIVFLIVFMVVDAWVDRSKPTTDRPYDRETDDAP